jgi:hypothetical protein
MGMDLKVFGDLFFSVAFLQRAASAQAEKHPLRGCLPPRAVDLPWRGFSAGDSRFQHLVRLG